jgi:hypothetical protein
MTFLRSIAAVAATVLLAAFCATGAQAAGTLTPVQAFTNGGSTLTVYTYTDGSSTIALLGVTNSAGVKFSFAIDKANLAGTVAGWEKARALPAASAAAAATVAENGTAAQDVLLLAGGPGVRFSIADPVSGIDVFTLPPAQYAAFDAALTLATNKITV